jgi:hypothetical protein
MKKNTASQIISFQLISTTDGSNVTTGSPKVYVTGDGGAQAERTTGINHEGYGCWSFEVSAADSNYNHVSFTIVLTGAVSQTVNVYPTFPQTGDSFGLIGTTGSGLTSLATQASVNTIDDFLDTEIAAIKAKTDSLTFTVAGQVDANTLKIGGTTQTGRDIGASVLLSSGTGTGQLSFTSGVVKADVETIKTRAVTCAAGVTVLASVGTAATSTAQTGDSFARIGATGSGLTTLATASELALVPKSTGSDTFNATCVGNIKSGLSTQAELDLVPKSTGTVSFNPTALAAVGGAAWDAPIASHLTALTTGALLQDIDNEVDTIHTAILDLAVTGAPLNITANGRTLNAGTTETDTYAATEFSNNSRHILTVNGTTIDVEYLFTLPNAYGVPTSVEIEGYLKESVPAGQDTIALMVYNYVSPGWDTIDTAVFTGITTNGPDVLKTHNLLARHVGTAGGDIGKMRVRFYSNSIESGGTLNIDMINVGYAEAISTSIALILSDTNDLQTQVGTAGAGLTSLPAVTLKNGAHGGAATVLTFKQLAGTNSDAGGSVISLTGSGSGNSHGIIINSTNGKAIALGAVGDAVTIDSSGAKGLVINGAAADIDANITGTLATVTNLTNAPTVGDLTETMKASVNTEVDTALNTAMPASPTAKSPLDYIKRLKFAQCNKLTVNETSGNSEIFDDEDTSFATKNAAFTSLAGVTKREKVI